MPRYFLEIQYKGSRYSGLSSQSNNPRVETVQGLIDKALTTLLKASITSTTSSRTDAGVHAKHQVLHTDLPSDTPTENLTFRLNRLKMQIGWYNIIIFLYNIIFLLGNAFNK